MTASSASIAMKVLLVFSLVGHIIVASSDTALPPEISKCCTNDTAPECKRIDAAFGYEGHLYTFFGPFYAKLSINSEGIPEALEGYPKKIMGKKKDNWFKNVKVTWESPLTAAFSADDCVRLFKKARSYCFEIKAAIDGETIEWKNKTVLYPETEYIVALMGTKFAGQVASWRWYWAVRGKCYMWITEGSKYIALEIEIPTELIPRAVAGFLVGDTFKGFVFLRDSGLAYPFTLKENETKLTPGAERIKASQFMGCFRVPKSTDGTTASTTTKETGIPGVTSSTTDDNDIPQMYYIVSGAYLGVLALGFMVLGCFWLVTGRGSDSGGGRDTRRGGGRVESREGGQERRYDEARNRSDDEPRDRQT